MSTRQIDVQRLLDNVYGPREEDENVPGQVPRINVDSILDSVYGPRETPQLPIPEPMAQESTAVDLGSLRPPEPEPVPLGTQVQHGAGQFGRGILDVLGAIPKGGEVLHDVFSAPGRAIGERIVEAVPGLESRERAPMEERLGFRAGEAISGLGERLPYHEEAEDSYIPHTLAGGVGSMMGFVGLGALTGGVGAMTAAGAMGASRGYEEARARGLSEEEAVTRGAMGVGPGMLQAATPVRILTGLKHLNRATGGSIQNRLFQVARQSGLNGVNEMLVNTVGEIGFNAIGDRDLTEGMVQAMIDGGIIGAVSSALLGAPMAAFGGQQVSQQEQAEAQEAVQELTAEQPPTPQQRDEALSALQTATAHAMRLNEQTLQERGRLLPGPGQAGGPIIMPGEAGAPIPEPGMQEPMLAGRTGGLARRTGEPIPESVYVAAGQGPGAMRQREERLLEPEPLPPPVDLQQEVAQRRFDERHQPIPEPEPLAGPSEFQRRDLPTAAELALRRAYREEPRPYQAVEAESLLPDPDVTERPLIETVSPIGSRRRQVNVQQILDEVYGPETSAEVAAVPTESVEDVRARTEVDEMVTIVQEEAVAPEVTPEVNVEAVLDEVYGPREMAEEVAPAEAVEETPVADRFTLESEQQEGLLLTDDPQAEVVEPVEVPAFEREARVRIADRDIEGTLSAPASEGVASQAVLAERAEAGEPVWMVNTAKGRVAYGESRLDMLAPAAEATEARAETETRNWLDNAAEAARARIREREEGTTLFTGLDPTYVADYAIVGAAKIQQGARSAKQWIEEMVKEFGEAIRPHIEQIRAASNRIAKGDTSELTSEQRAELESLMAPEEAPVAAQEALEAVEPTETPAEVLETDSETPESPPRPGPPVREKNVEAMDRLDRNLHRLDALHDQLEDGRRIPLGEDLRSQVSDLVTGVLTPKQVQGILGDAVQATTHLQAQQVVSRAKRLLDNELHRRAVSDLQSAYKQAKAVKLRPEFREMLTEAVKGIDTAKLLDNATLPGMQSADVRALADEVRSVVHQNKNFNKMLGRERGRKQDEVAQTVVSEVERLQPLQRARNIVGKLVKEQSTRPEVLIENLSPELQRLYYEDIVIEGQNAEHSRAWSYRDALGDAVEAAGHEIGTQEFENWRTETLELNTPDGPVPITRDEAIWLLTTIKDPTNRAFLLKNGMTVDRLEQERPGTDKFEVDEATIEHLQEIMSDAEESIAQAMFDQFNTSMKQDLNTSWLEVFGYEVAQVPEYVPRSIDVDHADTKLDPLARLSAERDATIKSWGHLRERTGSRAPLRIGSAMDTYNNHANNVARISSYLVPTYNAYAILGKSDVKRSIMSRVGKEGYDRILNAINMQTVKQPPQAEWLRNRMRMFGAAALGLRVSTLGLNPSGLAISAAYQDNGFSNLLSSIDKGFNPAEWTRVKEMAQKYSPYWRTRYDRFAHEITSGIAAERRTSYGRPGIAEMALAPLQKSDQFGATIRWNMAERHVNNTTDLQPGTDEYGNAVAREWERLMYRGENTAHGGDMSGFLALGRKNPVFGTFVMFQSSVSKIYSLGVRGVLQAQRGDIAGATRSAAGVIAATVWARLVREAIVSARGQGEDDEVFAEQVLKGVPAELIGYVPVVGSMLAGPVRQLMGGSAYTYPSSAIESALRDGNRVLSDAISTVETSISGELEGLGEPAAKRHLMNTLDGGAKLVAQWFGAPYEGSKDVAKMTRNITQGMPKDERDAFFWQPTTDEGLTQNRLRLFQAIQLNDPKRFREAVEALHSSGAEVDHAYILAIINRGPYRGLARYERGKPDRRDLTPEQTALVDQYLSERDELRRIATTLTRENRDLLTRSGGRARRPQRPQRPQRATR